MKLKLFTFALLALLVAGCTDNINLPEPDENDVSENEVRMVTISANMSPETRVSYTENPNNTITVAWEEDDQLMLVGFDDNNEYKGKSIFSKSGTGNEFSGLTIADATKYKAYYPRMPSKWIRSTPTKFYWTRTATCRFQAMNFGNRHRLEIITHHISTSTSI